MTGPQVQVMLWPGSGSHPVGKTPFGLFDDDNDFIDDAPKVAKWVCNSLGYPVMAVELTDSLIYSQFEKAVVKFSAQVNEFNMREHMLSLQGTSNSASISQTLIKSSPLPYIVELSQMYGTEASAGGMVDYKKGYITLQSGVQDYDLNVLWAATAETGSRIEIRRIWNDRPPAMNRYFDPFAGGASGGAGIQNLLGEFGWGSYTVASQYLLMPLYETLLRVQAIELNDQIRRSQFGFELKNNNLRIFPLPGDEDQGTNLWFEYTVVADKFASVFGAPGSSGAASRGVTSDYSNAPYDTICYSNINDVGRNWIWEYTLALCKIVLGGIRSKYDVVPTPNNELRLDGLTLRQEGQQEIDRLVQELRESLEQTGKQKQLEKAAENEENAMDILKKAPIPIYIF